MVRRIISISSIATVCVMFAVCLSQPAAADALEATKDAILAQIDAGQYEAANAAVAQMEQDFAGQAKLARRVWEAANRFEGDKHDKVAAFDYAKKLCEHIVARYPQDIYATYASLELAKLSVYELIDAGNDEAAQAGVSAIITDFAGHKQHSRRLNEIANRYQWRGALAQAKALYAAIAADYPGDKYGKNAALQKTKLDIYELIDQGKHPLVDSAVSQMAIDFAGHPDLAKRLCEIANKYDKVKAFDYSKALYKQIVEAEPNAVYASNAGLQLAKLKAFELIDAGDFNEADAVVSKMTEDFQGHAELSRRLYEVAQRFAHEGGRPFGKALHNRIAADYPDDKYGASSAIQAAKLAIYDMLDANDLAGADAAVAKMKSDFAGYEILTGQLESVADKYETAGDVDAARSIYDEIIKNCPKSSKAAICAKAQTAKYDVFSAVEVFNEAAYQGTIDRIANTTSDVNQCTQLLFCIAEQLYTQGVALWSTERDRAKDYFICSADLYENEILGYTNDKEAEADACLQLAVMYNLTGRYLESSYYYEKLLSEHPFYRLEWYALYTMGRNYENLKLDGLIEKDRADQLIKSVYEELIAKYPNCDYTAVKYAERWLNRHRQTVGIKPDGK